MISSEIFDKALEELGFDYMQIKITKEGKYEV